MFGRLFNVTLVVILLAATSPGQDSKTARPANGTPAQPQEGAPAPSDSPAKSPLAKRLIPHRLRNLLRVRSKLVWISTKRSRTLSPKKQTPILLWCSASVLF